MVIKRHQEMQSFPLVLSYKEIAAELNAGKGNRKKKATNMNRIFFVPII